MDPTRLPSSSAQILAEPRTGANYLFLQGPIGPFFRDLARRLSPSGAGIHRIHLCGGDSTWWRFPGAVSVDYGGPAEAWCGFLREKLADWRISDLVLFGDCRPRHQDAIRLARLRGIRVHVFEEGYLRPNWVTLERNGVNRHSPLPRDPAWYRAAAQHLAEPESAQPVRVNFPRRAAEDVVYTMSLTLQSWRFPGYRTHKPWHPLREYAAGARRVPFQGAIRRKAAAQLADVLGSDQAFFLFPLQLHADAQIRFHSPFGDMESAIRAVIDSFARRAPPDTRLVLTEHPLDHGVVDLGGIVQSVAARAGLGARVVFIPRGSPEPLLRACRGLVTVNSTIGIVALGMGRPVVTLGDAIYNLHGLVFQDGLDEFWSRPTPPDPTLYDAFVRVVQDRTQVNGSFYSVEGRRLAVEGAARRLLATQADVLPQAHLDPSLETTGETQGSRSELGA